MPSPPPAFDDLLPTARVITERVAWSEEPASKARAEAP